MADTNSVFPSTIKIPHGLKDVLQRHAVTTELLETMTMEEWYDFEKICPPDVPFGLLLQVRHSIANRLAKVEEEQAKFETRKERAIITKIKTTVGKLFDGDEGIGTMIYVAEDVGLCAFHSIHNKDNTILQDTLSIDGYAVTFKAGYPALDVALYYVIDEDGGNRKGPFLELEFDSMMYEGCPITLLSFPAFDSQSRDMEDEDPTCINGVISRMQLEKNSALAVGHYSSFPNSSGGAVISKRGKLLGVHVEGIYHEDHAHYRHPSSPPLPAGPIYPPLPPNGQPIPALQATTVQMGNEQDLTDGANDGRNHAMLLYAVENVKHKASMAAFVPVYHLREVLKRENVIKPSAHKQGKRARLKA